MFLDHKNNFFSVTAGQNNFQNKIPIADTINQLFHIFLDKSETPIGTIIGRGV